MSFGVNVADESDDDDEDDSEKQQTTTLAPQILWLPQTLHSTHIHPHTHTHTHPHSFPTNLCDYSKKGPDHVSR